MQRAQGQRVRHYVRAVLAMPLHVSRLDPDRMTPERAVKAAHRALVGVRAQDLLGEAAAALAARVPGDGTPAARHFQGRQVQARFQADQVRQGRRKVLIEQQPRRGRERPRLRQGSLDLGPQPTYRAFLNQPGPAFGRVWADLVTLRIPQVPQLTLQVNERHRRALPARRRSHYGRTEVVDKPTDRLLGFFVADHGVASVGESPEQPEQQERLVRCPQLANARSAQRGQLTKQVITAHLLSHGTWLTRPYAWLSTPRSATRTPATTPCS